MKRACIAISCLILSIPSYGLVAQNRVIFDAFEAFPITYPNELRVRDFNADGIEDLATVGDDAISILLCNGDGTFQAPVKYYYLEDYDSFKSLVVDDFDNDGDNDIAAACSFEHAVVIFLNDGTGAFTPIGEYPTLEYYPQDLCLSDFDGDGQGDIATWYRDWDGMGWEYISVLLSNGDGTFQPAVHSKADGYVDISAFYPSDFDDDGDMDLAIAANLTDEVIILFGKGDGTFRVSTPGCVYSSGGEAPGSITASDFDLDGDADLAVVNEESCRLAILFNQGDGTFINGPTYYPSNPPFLCPDYIYSSDIDADGDIDLTVTNSKGEMRVFLGDGEGNFLEDVYYYFVGDGGIPELCGGDFDLDGDTDLAATSYHTLIILINNGDGTFRSPYYYNLIYWYKSVCSSDLDGDWNTDLISISYNADRITVFLGNGDGTLEHLVDYVIGPDATSVCIADYNGDLTEDLAVINNSPHTVSILLGNGDGTFQNKMDFAAGGDPLLACTTDFDGDGAFDIAITNGDTRTVSILIGNGDGTFQAPDSYPTTSYIKHPYGICTSDFDGDGDNDIAVAADSLYWDSRSLGILMNNGDGTFQAPERYRSDWRTRKLVAADIDRDGDDDIVAKSTSGIRVSLNNGDGTFEPFGNYYYGLASFCVSDFNHDRVLDIVALGSDSRIPIAFFMGIGDGTFQLQQTFITGKYGSDICASDLDGDGDPDLAAALFNKIMITLNLTPIATSAENKPVIPSSPLLSQNFPNPFNPVTTFRFSLPRAGHVRITVYDAAGRRVAVITDHHFLAGDSEVVWDGRNERGRTLASGIYFARMTAGAHTSVKKLVLLR